MKLTRQVKRLEQTLPPPPVVDWQRQKRWHKVYKRWVGLCIDAQPLLGDDQDRVLTAILPAATEYTGPLATWFIHLHSGLCRLPELSPEAMKNVLLAWLSPEEHGGRVCTAADWSSPSTSCRRPGGSCCRASSTWSATHPISTSRSSSPPVRGAATRCTMSIRGGKRKTMLMNGRSWTGSWSIRSGRPCS